MQTDEALAARVEKEIKAKPEERVFSFDWQGEKVWLKQPEHVRNTAWINFARWACGVLGLHILQPGNTTNGKRALEIEGARLRRLTRLGMPVPRCVGQGDGWLVISDVGKCADTILTDKAIDYEERRAVLRELARNLAGLHREWCHHGRPAIRDMAWDDKTQKAHILDFEDGILPGLSPKRRQQRDVLLFIQSIFKECGSEAADFAAEALRTYEEEYPEGYRAAVQYFGSFTGIYTFFAVFLRYCGRDLESTYQILKLFRERRALI